MMVAFDASGMSAKGAEVRAARAALKAEIRRGEHSLIELFDQAAEPQCEPVLSGLRVEWFLRSIPGFGITKATRLLESLGINPRATLGGLRVRQRNQLRRQVVDLYRRYFPHRRGKLVVVVGPTAVGKGTIVSWITTKDPLFVVSVSATTRQPRPGERDGVHYHFVSDAEFDEMVRNKELLEWALVHGQHRYGTPRERVEEQLDLGRNVILEIDIQGARQVSRRFPRSITIFVHPPSFAELERRLEMRGTESEAEKARRLATAKRELAAASECDYQVVNDVVEDTGQSIVDLVTAWESTTKFEE
jgi:guanylate kinase